MKKTGNPNDLTPLRWVLTKLWPSTSQEGYVAFFAGQKHEQEHARRCGFAAIVTAPSLGGIDGNAWQVRGARGRHGQV